MFETKVSLHLSPRTQPELVNDTEEQQPEELNNEDEDEEQRDLVWEEIREGELNYTYVLEFIEIVNNVTDFKMINFTLSRLQNEFARPDDPFHSRFEDGFGRPDGHFHSRFEEELRRREQRHFSRFEDEFWHRENRHPSRFDDEHPEDPNAPALESDLKRSKNDTETDDLQIFYDNHIGHYTCVFYNASLKTVFVYVMQFHF